MLTPITSEQRMEQECERSLNQAKQTMQIIDAVIKHMMRPAPRVTTKADRISQQGGTE